MTLMVYIVAAVFITIGATYYIYFVFAEGKDERGQEILAKSSQFAFPLITFGLVGLLTYIQFADPGLEQMEMTVLILLALIWFGISTSIFFIRKNV